MRDDEGVKWRLLSLASAAVAVAGAAGLGISVAVNGVGRASGLAGVIAGFCELTALVLGVTGRAAKDRPASSSADDAEVAASNGASTLRPTASTGRKGPNEVKYEVDVRNVEGLQIGDSNVQRNYFGDGSYSGDQSGGPK